jgi:hypothetical protein
MRCDGTEDAALGSAQVPRAAVAKAVAAAASGTPLNGAVTARGTHTIAAGAASASEQQLYGLRSSRSTHQMSIVPSTPSSVASMNSARPLSATAATASASAGLQRVKSIKTGTTPSSGLSTSTNRMAHGV